MMMAFFPPISSEQGLNERAAVSPTTRPTSLDPVNEMARTSGCSAMGAPASGPNPVTIFTTPFGRPASVKVLTRFNVESGVSSAGLITQVLPQTRAGNSFHEGMAMGKFHGAIIPQTPIGMRTAMANLLGSSEGTVAPNKRRPSPAM